MSLPLPSDILIDAHAIAEALEKQVPGLTMLVLQENNPIPYIAVNGRYDCPCGEISGFQEVLPHAYRLPTNIFVEMLIHRLRQHVIGEGNVPNF